MTEEATARAAIAQGRLLETQDRLAEAAICYESVWESRTRHASVLQHAAHAAFNLGWLRSVSGRTVEAKAWYERAYDLRDAGPAAPEAARLAVVSLMMLHESEGNRAERARWWRCLIDNLWIKIALNTSDRRLELTALQRERLQAFLNECVEECSSTHAVEHERAEDSIARVYAVSGRARPRFIWCSSPAECLRVLRDRQLVVEKQLSFEQLLPRAKSFAWPYIRSQLGRELAGTPVADAFHHLEHRLWHVLGREVWRAIEESRRPEAGYFRQRHGVQAHHVRGPHDATYFVGRWFCREQLNVRLPESICEILDCWRVIVRSCGFWLPFDDVCLVSERPSAHRRDERGLPHSESDFALAYGDGFAFCSWHGIRVPDEWILRNESVNPTLALSWENIEQRRALAEIIGPERLLSSLPHGVVDVDRDPEIGTLLRIMLPGVQPAQYLKVRCGTGREFILRVPPDVTTAQQANAWTYGLDGAQYTPEVRT